MARLLGTAVHGIMLGARQQLVISVAGGVALKAAHDAQAHAPVHIWILAVGLLSAPPAGITENIDVGGPERQALVLA